MNTYTLILLLVCIIVFILIMRIKLSNACNGNTPGAVWQLTIAGITLLAIFIVGFYLLKTPIVPKTPSKILHSKKGKN
jgi:hypothetical protein